MSAQQYMRRYVRCRAQLKSDDGFFDKSERHKYPFYKGVVVGAAVFVVRVQKCITNEP